MVIISNNWTAFNNKLAEFTYSVKVSLWKFMLLNLQKYYDLEHAFIELCLCIKSVEEDGVISTDIERHFRAVRSHKKERKMESE